MKILMSGSGSGGHIYPCIALYKELIKSYKIIVIVFKEIDKKIYDLNNIEYIYIPNELSSFEKIKKINKIIKENNIDKTITFGGKNSFYINIVSKLNKIDNYIFEQNSTLGKANKLNYLLCKKIFTNFKLKLKKEINVGNPNAFKLNYKKINLFNNKNKITIFITLGSLGSSSVNKVIEKLINENKEYNFIYVSGNNVKSNIKNSSNVKIFDFYNNLVELMNISDIVISRAGASTISEIIALNKVSILIPSPYVSNDHQYKNAKVLLDKNSCILINEKDLCYEKINNEIKHLLTNNKKYQNIKTNLLLLKKSNGFSKIIKEINK